MITFAPNAGYVLGSVTVDNSAASLTGNSYTFINVTSDHNISVAYQKNDGSGGGGSGGGTAISDRREAA